MYLFIRRESGHIRCHETMPLIYKLDVQKGLYTLPVSPFEAQRGKLWPTWQFKKFKIHKKLENQQSVTIIFSDVRPIRYTG